MKNVSGKNKALVLMLSFVSSWSYADSSLYTDLDFDKDNFLTTTKLVYFAEPMNPTSTQLGPKFVAKGKPLFSPEASVANPPYGFTVAPGTQYQFGVESSCRRVGSSETCVRDNALSVEVYGDNETIVNGGIQDKAMMTINDITQTEPDFIKVNKSSAAHKFNFDLKFDKFYEVALTNTMHFQSFQPVCGPSVSLQVLRWDKKQTPLNTPIKTYLQLRKNSLDPNNNTIETFRVCENVEFNRGEWNNIYLKLQPGHGLDKNGKELGRVLMYRNGKMICEFQGNWGLIRDETGASCGLGHTISVGTYGARTIQKRKVYFDNIRYGMDFVKTRFGKSRIDMPGISVSSALQRPISPTPTQQGP